MQDLTGTADAVSDLEEAEHPISEAVEEVHQDMPQPEVKTHHAFSPLRLRFYHAC